MQERTARPAAPSSGREPCDLDEIRSVTDIVERMERAASDDKVHVRDVVATLGEASFLPVLMAPALAVVSPLSGVPLFSSICGLTIALVSAQLLFNRDHLWLPDWLMRRRIRAGSLKTATQWLRKPARFLDRHSKERLSLFVRRPFKWITQAACLCCGLAMPFLELVPFTSSILGFAVTLFALSLLVRDGLIAAVAFAVVGGAIFAGLSLLG